MATIALETNSLSTPPRVLVEPLTIEYQHWMTELALREGYDVHLEYDMLDFVHYLETAPKNDGVNPALDPRRSQHDDAFWVRIEKKGEIAGVMGQRFIDCNGLGYYDVMRAGRLFGDGSDGPVPLLISAAGATGRCCFGGGIYVHPKHRGTGMSWFLANLGRAIAIRIWNLNAAHGMVFEALRRNGMAEQNYGAHRTIKVIEGYLKAKSDNVVMWSLEYDIPPLLQRMRDTVMDISNGADKQMRDLAPRTAGKRKH